MGRIIRKNGKKYLVLIITKNVIDLEPKTHTNTEQNILEKISS